MARSITDGLPAIQDLSEGLSEADRRCLVEIREVLIRHDRVDRFGVNLLHKHFELKPGERLIESTDTEARTQRIEAVDATEVDDADVIETAWRFLPGDADRNPVATMECIMGCFGPSTTTHEYRAHTGVKR